jgi:hypothetical protein
VKKSFNEFRAMTPAAEENLWSGGLFAFDTSVLLDLYDASIPTRNAFLGTLKPLKGQLWLPHQVGVEFYNNRQRIIGHLESKFQQAAGPILKLSKAIDETRKWLKSRRPDVAATAEPLLTSASTAIESCCVVLKDCNPIRQVDHDPLLDEVHQLFDGAVGPPFERHRLIQLYEEGRVRFELKVPPGFQDSQKGDVRQYGDFLMWIQLIEKATIAKKPVALVINDSKGDWWLNSTRGLPRPELVREMRLEAEQPFKLYKPDQFQVRAEKHFALKHQATVAAELQALSDTRG